MEESLQEPKRYVRIPKKIKKLEDGLQAIQECYMGCHSFLHHTTMLTNVAKFSKTSTDFSM